MVADGIVPLTSGYDMTRACALQAVGMDLALPDNFLSRSVVLRFLPSVAGVVKEISGFAEEDQVEGVVCEPMVEIGKTVGKAASDGDRMAFLLAAGDTIADAMARADLREKRIRIVVG